MKTALTILSLALSTGIAGAQDTVRTASTGLAQERGRNVTDAKTWDAYLPAWSFDIKGRVGALSQDMTLIDFNQAFPQSLATSSNYPNPTFSNGRASGGEFQLNWFFSRNKRWGIGLGAMYMKYTGDLELGSDFKADYRDVDDRGRVYRQIVTLNSPVQEALDITNLNVPLLLKYKWTFAHRGQPGGLGLTIEGGPVFGLYNQTKASATGSFNYEAIYKLKLEEGRQFFVFDDDNNQNSYQTFLMTRDAIAGNDQAQFESLHAQNEGWNVGLNLPITESKRTQNSNYNAVSLGGMVQMGISYHLTYNLAFQLSGYGMYQRWTTTGNEGYKFTEDVEGEAPYSASYSPLTGAAKYADYISYGVSAGFRVYFGGKRDLDGDGFEDSRDGCREIAGTYNGCRDSDGDGIPDGIDECASIPGLAIYKGCPDSDGDGVEDRYDACVNEPGDREAGGCPLSERIKAAVDSTLRGESGYLMSPHIVLKTDVLYFDFKSIDLPDTAKNVLDYAVAVLSKESKIVIHLSGHTDDVGNERANLILSYQRAKSARDYLMEKGVAKERIILGGQGQESPVDTAKTPEARAKNRRLELKLLLPL